ncbi:MAG TPA: hypothetical protein PKD64_18730 [Pirellulaceae bacterium]|nr:hypothetical protein [Pirellulaceae bacterium]HMO94227.1 hypothetical protein [Pirellulaceae bacterium]HMP71263.1 hypothetical protein [Pirellulaceae bacterium]
MPSKVPEHDTLIVTVVDFLTRIGVWTRTHGLMQLTHGSPATERVGTRKHGVYRRAENLN